MSRFRLITKEDRAAAKAYYTRGKTRFTIKGLEIEFFLSEAGGYFSAMCFRGTAGRPAWNYRFKTAAQREACIRREIEGQRQSQKLREDYKAKREAPSKLQPGHILVTCWGYDQTNRDFYKIIATKGTRTIIVQKLAQIRSETGWMTGNATPADEFAKGSKPMTCRVQHGNSAKIEGHYASLWDGTPKNWTSYA